MQTPKQFSDGGSKDTNLWNNVSDQQQSQDVQANAPRRKGLLVGRLTNWYPWLLWEPWAEVIGGSISSNCGRELHWGARWGSNRGWELPHSTQHSLQQKEDSDDAYVKMMTVLNHLLSKFKLKYHDSIKSYLNAYKKPISWEELLKGQLRRSKMFLRWTVKSEELCMLYVSSNPVHHPVCVIWL